MNPPTETATPETDAATNGIGHVFATAKLCKKLELERNRLRERVAALEALVANWETNGQRLIQEASVSESWERDAKLRSYGVAQLRCAQEIRETATIPAPVAPAADAAPVPMPPLLTAKGMEASAKCRFCGEYFEKKKPWLCPGCWETVKEVVSEYRDELLPPVTAPKFRPDPTPETGPLPCPEWYALFEHLSQAHGLSLLGEELYEIALKVDESRAAAQPAPVPATAPALTREQIFILNHAVQEHAIRDIGNGLYTLTAAGLIAEDTMRWFRITEAGRRALREQGEAK